MTKAELKKVLVVEKLNNRHVTVAGAAALLRLSTRQVLRLKKVYLEKGSPTPQPQTTSRNALAD